jgi:hypothetical protein
VSSSAALSSGAASNSIVIKKLPSDFYPVIAGSW